MKKLHISFNMVNLEEALSIADKVEKYGDAFEIGSLLIAQYGLDAVKKFRAKFPEKTLFCKSNIVEYEKETVALACQAGSDWITVLAGASRNTIHNACLSAHDKGKKVILDLIDTDASSCGQIALEAKSLGAQALLFRTITDTPLLFLDNWDMVSGNTKLPIFISAPVTLQTVHEFTKINAAGIVVGSAITHAENPAEAAKKFAEILS